MSRFPQLPGPVRNRCLATFVWLLATCPPPAAAAAADCLLDFGNGDFLRGEPLAMAGDRLNWRHGLTGAEMVFPKDSILRILFGTKPPGNPRGDILLLQNGDIIAGKLDGLDEKSATITTPYAGKVLVPRDHLSAARLAPAESRLVYHHTGDLKGWKSSLPDGTPSGWTGQNGVMAFNGRKSEWISRDVGLPESSDVSFDLAWDANPQRQTQLTLGLFIPPDAPASGGDHYSFSISRSMLSGQRLGEEQDQHGVMGRVQISSFAENESGIRVRLIIDRPRQRVLVLINDRLAGEWEDKQAGVPRGSGIRLSGYPGMGLRLRNLRVESWNGIVGATGIKEKSGGDRDLLLAHDGDEMFGRILGVKTNPAGERMVEILLSVDKSKPASFPVSILRHISFASPAAGMAHTDPEARLRLADGTHFGGKITALGRGSLQFSLFNNPPVQYPFSAIAGIDFPRAADPVDDNTKQTAPETSDP